MTRQSDSSFYLASDVFTTFKTTANFIVVGCPTCQSNNGYIQLHSLPSLKKKKGIIGGSKGKNVGQSVSVGMNVEGAEQIWYSSRKSTTLYFNTMLAFQDFDTELWKYHDVKD